MNSIMVLLMHGHVGNEKGAHKAQGAIIPTKIVGKCPLYGCIDRIHRRGRNSFPHKKIPPHKKFSLPEVTVTSP